MLEKEEDVFQALNFALDNYFHLKDTIDRYSYDSDEITPAPVTLSFSNYLPITELDVDFGGIMYMKEINDTKIKVSNNKCIKSREDLMGEGIDFNFSDLLKVELKIFLKTVEGTSGIAVPPPNCLRFRIKVNFSNLNPKRQMLMSMETDIRRIKCEGYKRMYTYNSSNDDCDLRSFLFISTIIMCFISVVQKMFSSVIAE